MTRRACCRSSTAAATASRRSPVDSFYDVLTGKIPATKYADKIVLIGATAAGVGTSSRCPASRRMTPGGD